MASREQNKHEVDELMICSVKINVAQAVCIVALFFSATISFLRLLEGTFFHGFEILILSVLFLIICLLLPTKELRELAVESWFK